MALWLITRPEGVADWDENEGFVIRAATATEARLIASKQRGDEDHRCWLDANQSSCEEITGAGPDGVILGSFKAG